MVRVVSPSSRSRHRRNERYCAFIKNPSKRSCIDRAVRRHRRNERYCAFIKNPSKRSCIVASSAVKELPFDRVAPSGVKDLPFDRVAPSGELPVR